MILGNLSPEDGKPDIKAIRARSGLTRQAFCKKYEIPIRTLEKWERGEREPAEYIVALLDRAVREDFE